MKWEAAAAACRIAVDEKRNDDLDLLRDLLALEEISDSERDAFSDMLSALHNGIAILSTKQREWGRSVRSRHVPEYENLVSSGKVAKTCSRVFEFEMMPKPKRPPRPRSTDDET